MTRHAAPTCTHVGACRGQALHNKTLAEPDVHPLIRAHALRRAPHVIFFYVRGFSSSAFYAFTEGNIMAALERCCCRWFGRLVNDVGYEREGGCVASKGRCVASERGYRVSGHEHGRGAHARRCRQAGAYGTSGCRYGQVGAGTRQAG